MPGITNNINILNADNQLILTQNEQTTAINGVAGAIDALTEQVAAIKTQMAICCSGGGDLEGEGPQSALTPVQMDKKCIMSNYIFDTVVNLVTILEESNVGTFTSAGALLSSGVIFLLAGSAVDGPLLFADILALLAIAAVTILGGLSDLNEIISELTDHRTAIITDLYAAITVEQARTAFLNNVSLTGPEVALLNIFLAANVLKIIFVDKTELPAYYNPATTCGENSNRPVDCQTPYNNVWGLGTPSLLSETDVLTNGTVTAVSAPAGSPEIWWQTSGVWRITITAFTGCTDAMIATSSCDTENDTVYFTSEDLPVTVWGSGVNIAGGVQGEYPRTNHIGTMSFEFAVPE